MEKASKQLIMPNKDCIDLIMQFEGFEAKAYKCPAGVWTIGYGRTDGVKEGMTTTKDKEAAYLQSKAYEIAVEIQDKLKDVPSQGQINALTSFAYNLGIGALTSSTLFKKHLAGDFATAQNEFTKWNKARVNGELKVLDGLTRRRKFEAIMYGH